MARCNRDRRGHRRPRAVRRVRRSGREPRRGDRRRTADRQPRRPAARCRRHHPDPQLEARRQRRRRAADGVRGARHRRRRRRRCGTPARSTAPRRRWTYAGAPLTSRTRGVVAGTRRGTATARPRRGATPSSVRDGPARRSPTGATRSGSSPRRRRSTAASTIDVGEQDGRYVRLDVTKLGLPLYEPSYGLVSRIQLSEMEVLAPDGTNLALGRSVSVVRPVRLPGLGHASCSPTARSSAPAT